VSVMERTIHIIIVQVEFNFLVVWGQEGGFPGVCRMAVAQEVIRAVVWQQEGCWFDPRAPPPPPS